MPCGRWASRITPVTPFRLVHDFDADTERYWKVFFHEPYNVALYQDQGVGYAIASDLDQGEMLRLVSAAVSR